MSILRTLLATAALTLVPTAAFADTFSVFQVQGTFTNLDTLSGTLTLDTTTGMFAANPLNNYYVSLISQGSYSNGDYVVTFQSSGLYPFTDYNLIYLKLPSLPSAGQTLSLCAFSTPCGQPSNLPMSVSYEESVSGVVGQYRYDVGLTTGQISPLAVSTATPEPSSFMLLGTGLIAVGAAFRRRLFC